MIRDIHTSAPGKMLLLGEYAVLEGAPALVMAVDRRAEVHLRRTQHDTHRVSAPSLGVQDAGFRITADGDLRWQDPAQRLPLLESTVAGLLATRVVPDAGLLQPGFDLSLDTTAFYDAAGTSPGQHGTKLGFGSSAALTVAAASALAIHAGRGAATANRRIWLEQLLHLHRDFQGGRGSGADIAASLLGGLIDYRLRQKGEILQPAFRTARLPQSLVCRFIWTGKAASTGDFLERLEQWRRAHSGAYDTHMQALGAIAAEAAETACAPQPDGARFLDAAARYAAALDAFGTATGLPIHSAEHRALADIARQHGVVFKPCGAGGGDFGVALCDDPERAQAAVAAMQEAGFSEVALPVAPEGLHIDYEAHRA